MTEISGYSEAELAEIRGFFPILGSYTFLNSASMAPLPTPARDAISRFTEELSETAYLGMEQWLARIDATRATAATLVGAEKDEIAFIRNTSDGVSLVASGLRLNKGDEVIINDLEFPSNVYPWLNLESKGVIIRTVKSEQGRVTPELIAAQISNRTKVIAISTVQYSTGYRADLSAIGALAREAGALFFVDAIQSLGLIPIDVKKHGIDFLSCGGHKWLCGPEGIGVFYIDKENIEELDLLRVGWHTVENAIEFSNIDFVIKKSAERFEEGTANLAGIFGLKASLDTIMERGVERNFAHVVGLNKLLAEGLKNRGAVIDSPRDDPEELSGITIFTTGSKEKNAALAKKLEKERILVINRGAGIRVSPHFFNSSEDIERLIETVQKDR